MTLSKPDPLATFIAEVCDGERWAVLRADRWDDFVARLSDVVVELPTRRRQALIMLLFALAYDRLTPGAAKAWLDAHDLDSDDGIEAMISWLRPFRPPPPPGP